MSHRSTGALTIVFTVEDTLPRTSIEATFCDGENYLGVQQQVLQMSIAVAYNVLSIVACGEKTART
jgi:hypothetical protein